MATYVSLRATSQRLIQKNGRTVTYQRETQTLVDAANPQLGNVTTLQTTSLKAAFINDAVAKRTATLVQQGDKIVLIAADDLPSIVPSTSDSILDGTTQYKIHNIESVDPSDAPVVYEMILRG